MIAAASGAIIRSDPDYGDYYDDYDYDYDPAIEERLWDIFSFYPNAGSFYADAQHHGQHHGPPTALATVHATMTAQQPAAPQEQQPQEQQQQEEQHDAKQQDACITIDSMQLDASVAHQQQEEMQQEAEQYDDEVEKQSSQRRPLLPDADIAAEDDDAAGGFFADGPSALSFTDLASLTDGVLPDADGILDVYFRERDASVASDYLKHSLRDIAKEVLTACGVTRFRVAEHQRPRGDLQHRLEDLVWTPMMRMPDRADLLRNYQACRFQLNPSRFPSHLLAAFFQRGFDYVIRPEPP